MLFHLVTFMAGLHGVALQHVCTNGRHVCLKKLLWRAITYVDVGALISPATKLKIA
jgi:hypothetical protein